MGPFAHPCSVIPSCSSKTKLLNLSPRPWSPLSSLIPFCSHDTMVPGFSLHLRAFAHAGLAAWNVISSSSLLSSRHSSNFNQISSSISWTLRLDWILTVRILLVIAELIVKIIAEFLSPDKNISIRGKGTVLILLTATSPDPYPEKMLN